MPPATSASSVTENACTAGETVWFRSCCLQSGVQGSLDWGKRLKWLVDITLDREGGF
jgi:hypothetical protein